MLVLDDLYLGVEEAIIIIVSYIITIAFHAKARRAILWRIRPRFKPAMITISRAVRHEKLKLHGSNNNNESVSIRIEGASTRDSLTCTLK